MSDLPATDALVRFRQQQAGHYAQGGSSSLVGVSPAIVRARAQLDAAVASNANTHIGGPNGEALLEVAHAIHYRTHPHGDASLWHIDASTSLPSELGRAISALMREETPGTLIVESVDRLPAEQQAELLTAAAMEDWQSRIVTTALASRDAAPSGMSDELAAVVSTIAIELPALRDRPEDIPPLVDWHLQQLNHEAPESIAGVADDALDLLIVYPWPNDVAELRSVMTSAYRRARAAQIAAHDLPKQIHHAVEKAALASEPPQPIDLDDYLARVETALVERAIQLASGNKAEAARLLGVSRPRLYRKLVQMGVVEPPPSDQQPKSKSKPPEPARPERTQSGDDIEFLPVDGE